MQNGALPHGDAPFRQRLAGESDRYCRNLCAALTVGVVQDFDEAVLQLEAFVQLLPQDLQLRDEAGSFTAIAVVAAIVEVQRDSVMASSRGRSAWPAPGRADRRRPCLPPSVARRPRSVRQIRSPAAIGKNAGVLRRWAPVPEYRSGHRRPHQLLALMQPAIDQLVHAPHRSWALRQLRACCPASLFGRPENHRPLRDALLTHSLRSVGERLCKGRTPALRKARLCPWMTPSRRPYRKNSYGCLIGIPHPLWFSPNRYGRRSRADERPRTARVRHVGGTARWRNRDRQRTPAGSIPECSG